MNIMEQQMNDQLLAQHLDKVKSRLQSENLSVLEMRQRVAAKAEEIRSAPLDQRPMLLAEANMMENMATEAQGPEMSPGDMVAHFRSTGQHDLADNLGHGILVDNQGQLVAQKEQRLAELRENNAHQMNIDRAESELATAQKSLAELAGQSPVHDRQNARREKVREAGQLRDTASVLEISGDAGVQQQAQHLFDQADQIEAGLHE